jgi:putative ABC transport system ATP-binding protein
MQRVAIARAICIDPVLILADEPTGNLDSHSGIDILRIFEELHDHGATILLVTHAREVAAFAERKMTLRDGKFIETRPLAEEAG